MIRQSLSEDTVRAVVDECGATITEIGTTGSNHRYVVIGFADKHCKIFFGGTPSDRRAHLNLASSVRKAIRKMQ